MKRSLLTFLFIFLFLVSSAYALTEDFTASLDAEDIHTCECFQKTKQILVTNTGDITSEYDVFLKGDAATLAVLQPTHLALQPGQSTLVNLNFFDTCRDLGNYPFTVALKTQFGLEKELKSNFIIQKCKTLQVDVLSGAQVINNCEEAKYDFLVTNVGAFEDVVDISVDKQVANSASLSQNPLILAPQQSKQISLFVPTSCEDEGNVPFTIFFTGQNSGFHVDQDLSLIINNRDFPILAADVDTINVGAEESSASLTLENTGYDTVTYHFAITQGPEWLSISPNIITVPGASVATFDFTSAPPEDAEAGKYDVTLTATVSDTGVVYTKNFTVALAQSSSGFNFNLS